MMQLHRGTRPLAGMLAAGCVGVVLVLTLVSDGTRPAHRLRLPAVHAARPPPASALRPQRPPASCVRVCVRSPCTRWTRWVRRSDPPRTRARCAHQGRPGRCWTRTMQTTQSR